MPKIMHIYATFGPSTLHTIYIHSTDANPFAINGARFIPIDSTVKLMTYTLYKQCSCKLLYLLSLSFGSQRAMGSFEPKFGIGIALGAHNTHFLYPYQITRLIDFGIAIAYWPIIHL